MNGLAEWTILKNEATKTEGGRKMEIRLREGTKGMNQDGK